LALRAALLQRDAKQLDAADATLRRMLRANPLRADSLQATLYCRRFLYVRSSRLPLSLVVVVVVCRAMLFS
jgi:hypothetical protein